MARFNIMDARKELQAHDYAAKEILERTVRRLQAYGNLNFWVVGDCHA